jgi:hypothetical protein
MNNKVYKVASNGQLRSRIKVRGGGVDGGGGVPLIFIEKSRGYHIYMYV